MGKMSPELIQRHNAARQQCLDLVAMTSAALEMGDMQEFRRSLDAQKAIAMEMIHAIEVEKLEDEVNG